MTKNGILDVKTALYVQEVHKTIKNKSAIARLVKKNEKQIRRWLAIPSDRLKKLSTD